MAMSKKVSITLDDEVLDFVDRLASNRSRFINDYKDQANDPESQEEISVWDIAVGDGLNA